VWTFDPLIDQQNKLRVKFAPSADYDSDEDLIVKEKKRMISDLKQSIEKFVKCSDPLNQISNLAQGDKS
jgi:peptidase E